MKLTCLHIAVLWQRCESVSELWEHRVSRNRLCFVLFLFGQLRWKVPGVSCPDAGLSTETLRPAARSTQYWKAILCCFSLQLHRSGGPPWSTHVLFLPLHTSLAVWLAPSRLLGSLLRSCGLGKRDSGSFSSVLRCIFPFHLLCLSHTRPNTHTHIHTGSLSAFAWHFNREFWNLAAGFPWKALMEKAVALWTCDRRLRFYTVRQAKHVPLCTTFVLPSRLWMAFQYGRQGQGEGTHTGPNLSYKAALQATLLTLLPPSFFLLCLFPPLVDPSLLFFLSNFSTSVFHATSAFSPLKPNHTVL